MTMVSRRIAAQQRQVDRWNASQPIGSPVTLRMDGGKIIETKTTTEAQLLGGHTAVVWLEGVRGCYGLDAVSPLNLPGNPPNPATPASGAV